MNNYMPRQPRPRGGFGSAPRTRVVEAESAISRHKAVLPKRYGFALRLLVNRSLEFGVSVVVQVVRDGRVVGANYFNAGPELDALETVVMAARAAQQEDR